MRRFIDFLLTRNGTIFLSSIALIAVIAFGAALYIFLQSPAPTNQNTNTSNSLQPTPTSSTDQSATEESSTYRNGVAGYELKYKKEWVNYGPNWNYDIETSRETCVSPAIPNASLNDATLHVVEFATSVPSSCGWIVGNNLPSNEALLAIAAYRQPMDDISNIFDNPEQITIGGVQGYKYIFTENSDLPNVQMTRIFINTNGFTYEIFVKQSEVGQNYDAELDQYVKSISFFPPQSEGVTEGRPDSEDYDGWLTYVSRTPKFSVKYSPDFELAPRGGPAGNTLLTLDFTKKNALDTDTGMTLSVINYEGTLENFIKLACDSDNNCADITDGERVTVSGLTGVYFDKPLPSSPVDAELVYFKKDNYIIVLILNISDRDTREFQAVKDIYEKMYKSFDFSS